jgi:hypothetical protein
VTIGEAIALGGVVLSAGAAIERLRRMETSARAQYKRVGDTITELAELRGQVRVLVALLPEGRGVVGRAVASNTDEVTTPAPSRAMGEPPPPRSR